MSHPNDPGVFQNTSKVTMPTATHSHLCQAASGVRDVIHITAAASAKYASSGQPREKCKRHTKTAAPSNAMANAPSARLDFVCTIKPYPIQAISA